MSGTDRGGGDGTAEEGTQSIAETFEQQSHDSSNLYDRFYRGIERDLRSNSPSIRLYGAIKRAALRTAFSLFLALLGGLLTAIMAYAYYSSVEVAAKAFIGMATPCAPLVWASGWYGWLPKKEGEVESPSDTGQVDADQGDLAETQLQEETDLETDGTNDVGDGRQT